MRLREAAETAIDQLDWTISYFHRIRKHRLAAALKRNRDTIVQRMRGTQRWGSSDTNAQFSIATSDTNAQFSIATDLDKVAPTGLFRLAVGLAGLTSAETREVASHA